MDLPIDSMVIFHSYVKLPEGNRYLLLNDWGRPRHGPSGPTVRPTAGETEGFIKVVLAAENTVIAR